MRTRDILVVVSVLGVAATLIAVIEGAWIYVLAIYGMSVAGIAVLLGRAVRQHRARNDQLLRTAPDEAAQGPRVQPGLMRPHS
jgi:heme exporter protein D